MRGLAITGFSGDRSSSLRGSTTKVTVSVHRVRFQIKGYRIGFGQLSGGGVQVFGVFDKAVAFRCRLVHNFA